MWTSLQALLQQHALLLVPIFALGLLCGVALQRLLQHRARHHQRIALDDQLLDALERALRGDPREAFNLLQREANQGDASPSVYFALGAALRRMNMTEKAILVHRAILARRRLSKAQRMRAHLALAADYYLSGNAEKAQTIIKALPRFIRKDPILLNVRKNTALQNQNWNEVLASTTLLARKSARGKSDIADVHARIGEAALRNHQIGQAAKAFRRALWKDPDNLRARIAWAELLLKENKTAKARKHFIRALMQKPTLAPILLPRVRETLSTDNPKDLDRYIKVLAAIEAEASASLWVGIEKADLLAAAGKTDDAHDLLENLKLSHPHAFDLHLATLNFFIENNRDELALKHLQSTLALADTQILRCRCENCAFMAARPQLTCPRCGAIGTFLPTTPPAIKTGTHASPANHEALPALEHR